MATAIYLVDNLVVSESLMRYVLALSCTVGTILVLPPILGGASLPNNFHSREANRRNLSERDDKMYTPPHAHLHVTGTVY